VKVFWFAFYKLYTYGLFAFLCAGAQEVCIRFGLTDTLASCTLAVMIVSHLMLAYSCSDGDNLFKKALLMQYRHFEQVFPDYGVKSFIRDFWSY